MKETTVALKSVPLSQIKPYEKNAKKHPPEQIEKLARQIEEHGFDVPIVVDSTNTIIKGHGRLLALKKLKRKNALVIVRDDLTPEQIRAARLADNKLAESDFDTDLLAFELKELADIDFDIALTGFDTEFLASLLESPEPLGDMPDLPDGEKPPLQQMTFILHNDQAHYVKQAIEKAKKMGPFGDTGNENGNGNALARVCEMFLGGDTP